MCRLFLRVTLSVSILLFLFSCVNEEKNSKSTRSNTKDPMTSEKISEEVFSLSWDLLNEGQLLADKGSDVEEIIEIFPNLLYIFQIN